MAAVHDDYFDPVAVERIGRVALVDEDVAFQPLDPHVEGAAGRHVGVPLVAGQVAAREAVFLAGAFFDDAFVVEPVEDGQRFASALLGGAARSRREVFERKLIVGEFAQQAQNHRSPVAVFRPFGRTLFFCLFHGSLRICRARLRMKSVPASSARSSGAKVPVWGRPAAAPTPSR